MRTCDFCQTWHSGSCCPPGRATVTELTNATHDLSARVAELEAERGTLPDGAHPDEAKPRDKTWLAERANWSAEVERLRARVAALEGKLEEANHPPLCSVCIGKPLASGRQCICGGVGTEAAEMHGLRVECLRLADLETQLATARAEERERMREAVWEATGPLFDSEGCNCDAVSPNPHQCFPGMMEEALRRALTPTPEPRHA